MADHEHNEIIMSKFKLIMNMKVALATASHARSNTAKIFTHTEQY